MTRLALELSLPAVAAWRKGSASAPSTGAGALLGAETNGLAFSASDDSMEIRDTVTPANNFVGSTITKFGAVRASAGYYYNLSGILTSSASGLRRDYDPRVTGPKYLIEEARTNLSLQSEDMSNGWTVSGITVSVNSIAAPDGALTADLLTASSVTSFMYRANSTVAAGTYTWSCFFKKGTALYVAIGANDGAASNWSFFDLTTGLPASNTGGNTSTMTALSGGWFRCAVTRTIATTSAGVNIGITNADGNIPGGGVVGTTLYAWGAMLEPGASASSYIPTTSATVTRAADVPALLGTAFNISSTEDTLYARIVQMDLPGSNTYPINLNNGAATNIAGFALVGSNNYLFVTSAGSQVAVVPVTVSALAAYKMAAGYKLNDFAMSINGAAVVTDTVGAMPTLNNLNLSTWGGGGFFNGWLFDGMQLPRRMTNAQLVTQATP